MIEATIAITVGLALAVGLIVQEFRRAGMAPAIDPELTLRAWQRQELARTDGHTGTRRGTPG